MKRKAYENRILPPMHRIENNQLGAQPLVATCPSCSLKMVVRVTPLNINFKVEISSDDAEVARILKQQKMRSGS